MSTLLKVKLTAYFDKEMRKENLEYITRKCSYYRDLFNKLGKGIIPDNYDLENLLKFESELKKQKNLTIVDFVSRFEAICEELHMEGMRRFADNVLGYDYVKLFTMAQWNDNVASMMRIEHEFDVKLDRVMKRRIPQLKALIEEHKIDCKL